MDFDEGLLCVFDSGAGSDVQPAAEALVHRLFQLEKAEDLGIGVRMVVLPDVITPLPREKPLPKPRELTKWEVFAKEKGIQKKKRKDRMVWDEDAGEFKPIFGYKRAKSTVDVPIIPHRDDFEPGENPFNRLVKDKKKRAVENTKKRIANENRASGLKKVGKPLAAMETELGASGKKRIPKERLATSAKVAQISTASVGKFDRRVGKESEPKGLNKRRKFDSVSNTESLAEEKKKLLKVADRVFMPKPEPSTARKPTSAMKGKKKRSEKKR
eukprot:Plantae.Rhodophyta-Purpureofilum_apyrenoidigerum.ctg18849.p1 GENE.Plantae.Rhodophyta-Purpureofilum_apyrenoidigerum.ctg18849~~Plantae.Rhodophyta-Purpureofilum_apyrenoidigerum.ctg18849.p1  ORF type:complete len:271 (-),score=69.76 Plantae.Rhodophyta-Purpureofilum_apyrenoidigerum.ctg18849:435-1247(-)